MNPKMVKKNIKNNNPKLLKKNVKHIKPYLPMLKAITQDKKLLNIFISHLDDDCIGILCEFVKNLLTYDIVSDKNAKEKIRKKLFNKQKVLKRLINEKNPISLKKKKRIIKQHGGDVGEIISTVLPIVATVLSFL